MTKLKIFRFADMEYPNMENHEEDINKWLTENKVEIIRTETQVFMDRFFLLIFYKG